MTKDSMTTMQRRVERVKRRLGLGVEERSPFENIYHCCVQRTASQWFRLILNDEAVYRHTGLYVVPYIDRGLDRAHIDEPFPSRTIVAHLYVSRPVFDAIPKPDRHAAFFMTRDPRDIVVSFYFSALHSHKPMGEIPELRKRLAELDEEQGMMLTLQTLDGWGLFRAQRSWGPPGAGDVPVFKYEDLAADHRSFLGEVFDHLQIRIPDSEFEDLCRRKSFRAVSGREQGSEDVASHLRRGTPGDWHDKLPPTVVDALDEMTDGLPQHLRY